MSSVGDEAQLAVSSAEARLVADEIATLAAHVDALALRIDALDRTTQRSGPSLPPSKGTGRTKRNSG